MIVLGFCTANAPIKRHNANTPVAFMNSEVGLVDDSTIVVEFSQRVKAIGGDYLSGVTVKVDGVPVSVITGVRQADYHFVYYGLSVPVLYDQVVT